MRKFLKCSKGNIAVMFAMTIMPVMGAAGVTIDYSRALNVRSFVQSQADMTALAAAQLGPDGDTKPLLNYLRFVTEQRYGEGHGIEGMSIQTKWLSQVDYSVAVDGRVPVSILGAVPGFPSSVPISVISTVRVAEPRFVYKPPTLTELDNEAGDYNRLSIYCFDPEKKKDSKTKGRFQMTPISDNAGTKYKFEMPRCDAGQMLSYKLTNVRLVRDQPKQWDNPKATRFEFHTDTVLKQGADSYSSNVQDVLETVLCDNLKECKPKSQGGIIPEGKNRSPVRAKETCSPGKYMYYGWEDRPPNMDGPADDWTDIAWTDTDYDDIRVIIECPVLETVQERLVRLID